MATKITFVCEKEPRLAEFHDDFWRSRFEKELELYSILFRDDLLAHWENLMLADAKFQQHYDFTLDEQGKRVPVYEMNPHTHQMVPKLLIPKIVLS